MDDASRRQIEAADPEASTWLGANAGSGKTKVLTDRVARLLLGGADPARVLCLTYTKAAAAEMQNRLFKRLGEWAMAPDGKLAEALGRLGEADLGHETLARARRLFARALETPGGLKIQTIHAFCAGILRRFPLEAGVPPDFTEIDERSLARLRSELLERIALSDQAGRLEALLRAVSDGKLDRLLGELEAAASAFEVELPDPAALFGLPEGLDRKALLAEVLGHDTEMLAALAPALLVSGKTDQKLGAALALLARPDMAALAALEGALLFGGTAAAPFGSKAGKIPTKALRARLSPVAAASLDGLADRLAAARPLRLGLMSAEAAGAVWDFAAIWLPQMAKAKAARGWLGFDDLVHRTRRLLNAPGVAQWVLYRLDGGIDHILVDEAQDTSPAQWEIIERLVAEITAGEGASPNPRTLFVVGDRKQSIYSFQGADLQGFETMRQRLGGALIAAGKPFNPLELLHSFRSSPAVLGVVDAAFATTPGGLGGAARHLAFFGDRPGRVDLWPALDGAEKEEEGEWDDPLDRPAPTHPDLILARAIAAQIRALIDAGTAIGHGAKARALHEGDVLILVRRRKGLLFDALIQACKAEGLAMAGADRLVLGDEPSVGDILALLRWLALPEDDLSLAHALRSPLFGWSEDALYRLAQGRGPQGLWARLRDWPGAEATRAVLQDLRDQTDFLRPYELIERILGRHDGRRRLLARFGSEAAEPIEALSDLALQYDAGEVPTLDGFLGWLAASEAELKRQSESAGRRLRVMTVHGSKGLEAPVVILPDTAERRDQDRSVLALIEGMPVPRARSGEATPAQAEADAAAAALRAQERDRLLYVALTRAEQWLIVAASGKTDDPEGWYGRVRAAVAERGSVPLETPLGPGQRHEHGAWPAAMAQVVAEVGPAEAPGLLIPPAADAAPRLTPSQLGGAKALPGEAGEPEQLALARGRYMHRLLEQLPGIDAAEWPALAQRLAASERELLDEATRESVAFEAMELLRRSDLAGILGPLAPPALALTEVTLAGEWQGIRFWGVIDRLLILPDSVLAVDFKSNRVEPASLEEVPEGLLRQMGGYAQLLAPLHPGKRIETALLWTASARLMPLPESVTAAALDRAAREVGSGQG